MKAVKNTLPLGRLTSNKLSVTTDNHCDYSVVNKMHIGDE
ncbi:hypothetical protein FORC065_1655 [Yersinia enterocolitica]|nr:hypothetical protein FORC065_1655 [Yersinia enterocolitica]